MPGPLEGIRVVDWTIWQQGPVASAMLADLGAEVIKVESRDGGDPGRGIGMIGGVEMAERPSFYFEAVNRGKQSITVDLKKPEAVEIVRKLVAKSDVFVQNFRKGVAGRLGLGYDALRQDNEKLIYASATGYGPEGPDSADPSFDHLGLARSGMMMSAGEPDMEPLQVGMGIADQMGAVMLAYGVLAALVARERSGVGQQVDASHLGSMTWLQSLSVSCRLINGAGIPRMYRRESANPLWCHYRCADDKWIALAMLQSDRYWPDFCKAIGRPELGGDSRFASADARSYNKVACVAELDAVFASRPRDEWMQRLRDGGDFIFTLVNRIDDLPDDPQMQANGYIVEVDHPNFGPTKYLGCPIGLSKTPGEVRSAAPELGQNTELLLTELLGYDWDDIARLREEEII